MADSREFVLPSWRGTWLWSGSFGWFLTAVWFGTGMDYEFGTEDPSWWWVPAVCIPMSVLFSLLSVRKMKHNKVIPGFTWE